MPTSRYESYPKPSQEVDTKEEIVGEDRLEIKLGKLVIEPVEAED